MKDGLDRAALQRLAEALRGAEPSFDSRAFLRRATRGLTGMELKQRVRHAVGALGAYLPGDFTDARAVVLAAGAAFPEGDLERLKDDPAETVRRSVANNLNDIAKDHPDRIVKIARRWSKGASEERAWVIRHATRSLVKQGHPGVLCVLGSPARRSSTSGSHASPGACSWAARCG